MFTFDTLFWKERIKKSDWYLDIPVVLKELSRLHDVDVKDYEKQKELIYSFFEDQLKKGKVALGKDGEDQDDERKSIDTIVIHHSSISSGLTKDRLSAIELVRLYAPQYASNFFAAGNKESQKIPIYSGHWRDGIQVFWPYHWIIRTDGKCERLLNDNEIGWQAGNWDINCRSVAICLDNDYENSIPSQNELKALAGLIKQKYSHVSKNRIFGHCEINDRTSCPSNLFLNKNNQKGWKEILLEML